MNHPKTTHWKPCSVWQRFNLTIEAKNWLVNTPSLTAKIRYSCPDMTVEILSEKWQRPLNFEAKALRLKQGEFAWVRCVLLKCNHDNWIYARTVIPKMQTGNPWFALKKLGNQPLGEILFSLKQVKRSPFLLLKSFSSWPYLPKQKPRLARQSIFTQKNHKLLLTEVFLEPTLKSV